MGFAFAIVAMLAFAGPASAHHHGDFGSDDPAGTISSFDPASGVLTIDLADGGQISGLVTDETRIETGGGCRHGDHGDDERRGRKASALRHHFGDHGRGWHHGWGDDEGSTDDLVAGAVVDDAILILADGKATFVKVELADDSGDSTTTAKASKKARR
ncbi:MAG TPA: hypothetical protein VFJ57_06940 [Solirubrobacterales bacterium]|nr:hypothetical protein [Solirubrobacterales bacterium]